MIAKYFTQCTKLNELKKFKIGIIFSNKIFHDQFYDAYLANLMLPIAAKAPTSPPLNTMQQAKAFPFNPIAILISPPPYLSVL